jgi:hypothetical protein
MLYLKYMNPIIVFTQLEDHIHKDQNQTIFKNKENRTLRFSIMNRTIFITK